MCILCRKNEKDEKKMLKNAQIEMERLPPGHEKQGNNIAVWLYLKWKKGSWTRKESKRKI